MARYFGTCSRLTSWGFAEGRGLVLDIISMTLGHELDVLEKISTSVSSTRGRSSLSERMQTR